MSEELAARRREFPALDTVVNGHRLAYLDTAATCLVPRAVIDATARSLATLGNPGRGVHALADAATVAIEDARAEVARALGAAHGEIVFASNTTAAINLVAETWGAATVGAGDIVVASHAEHHSNLLPWQRLCERRGAELVLAGDVRTAITERTKLVAVAHVSNVLGTVAPIADIARAAHAAGARVLVDGAQAMAHLAVDVAALGCDFYAFSGHKVYGPPGAGVLWARGELLAQMPAWQVGGGMVGRDGPARFEAGTPNTPAIVGLAAALAWLRALDRAAIAAGEARVHAALCEVITGAGARILGAPELGVVAFAWDYHPHDIATIADGEGVALRSGHHCAEPIHRRLGVDASTRASVGCYSGLDDVAQLARALAKVREVLR